MEHTIQLHVDGKTESIILSEMVHPIHCMFHATFEDGYENIFFADVESGEWVEQDVGFTLLAAMIGKKVENLYYFDWEKKEITWFDEEENGKHIHFGYHADNTAGYRVYEIFAPNRRYMFTLVKLQNHVWQLFKIPGSGWDYNEIYIQKIPFILDEIVT
ncbi:MAG: hypothetical protein J7621_03850 [Niastella sp.]|nr:hypothetical protein [Niastella sp.]